VPFLIFTYGLQGMRFILNLGLHFTKKTKYHASITIAAAVVNIIVNIILIPYLHYWGAAITSIVSSFVLVALFYKYSQKFYPVKYEISRLTKLFVLAFIFLAAGLLLSLFLENFWLNIFIKTLLMISFPIFLYPMKFYQQNEIAAIKGIWKKWHKPKQLIENFKELAKVKDDSDDDEVEDSNSQ
jgi:O-antigen/teichoic acid export membrane protein